MLLLRAASRLQCSPRPLLLKQQLGGCLLNFTIAAVFVALISSRRCSRGESSRREGAWSLSGGAAEHLRPESDSVSERRSVRDGEICVRLESTQLHFHDFTKNVKKGPSFPNGKCFKLVKDWSFPCRNTNNWFILTDKGFLVTFIDI